MPKAHLLTRAHQCLDNGKSIPEELFKELESFGYNTQPLRSWEAQLIAKREK